MNKWTIVLVVLIALAGGVLFAWFTDTASPQPPAGAPGVAPAPAGGAVSQPGSVPPAASTPETGPTVGKLLPAFQLNAIGGGQSDVAGGGRIVVINFWTTWCPPCREEMPELNRFAARNSGQLAFYAVNLQEPADKVDAFMRQNGYQMPVLLDQSGNVARLYRISSIPTTVVADRGGVIQFRKSGPVTESELETVIRRIK